MQDQTTVSIVCDVQARTTVSIVPTASTTVRATNFSGLCVDAVVYRTARLQKGMEASKVFKLQEDHKSSWTQLDQALHVQKGCMCGNTILVRWSHEGFPVGENTSAPIT